MQRCDSDQRFFELITEAAAVLILLTLDAAL